MMENVGEKGGQEFVKQSVGKRAKRITSTCNAQ